MGIQLKVFDKNLFILLINQDDPEKIIKYLDNDEALEALDLGIGKAVRITKLISRRIDQSETRQNNVIEFPYRKIRR